MRQRIRQKQSKLSAFFFDQRKRVLASLEQMKGSLTSPLPSDGRGIKGEGFAAIFNVPDQTKRLLNRLTPLLRADLEFGFRQLADELGLPDLNLPSEKRL